MSLLSSATRPAFCELRFDLRVRALDAGLAGVARWITSPQSARASAPSNVALHCNPTNGSDPPAA